MPRRHTHLVPLLLVLTLALPPATPAHADGLKITGVTLGIGGRYRPGGWVPLTVTAVNSGTETVAGQVRLSGDGFGGVGAGTVFARPVTVGGTPGPQTFPLDVRGLDPGRQDVAAQVVSGDGRVLAEADSLSQTDRNLFSGIPVDDVDLLVIGFSADSSAFAPLNGRKWGLMHTAAGVAADTMAPASLGGGVFPPGQFPPGRFPAGTRTGAGVQIAPAAPADLPDKPAAYAGVDAVLLRADAPLDSLSEAQADALKSWVAAGGCLVVCGGADPAPLSNSFFAGLLPASVGPPPPGSAAAALTPKPLPGVRVLAAQAGRPMVVTGPFGAGRVTLLAFDPALPSAQAQAGPALWQAVFAAGPSSLLPVVAGREQGGAGGGRFNPYAYGAQSQLSEAVMRAPALDVPGADVIGLFLFAYVLILVPINYLVLKRLDKKEWAWTTIPALVAVFAAGAYAVGYAAKGSRVFVNRAAIVETSAGQRQAGLYAAVGLFSPRRADYALTVADPNALAAVPVPPNEGFNYRNRSQQPADGYGPVRVVEGASDVQVQDASVNMWAMRAFDTQTTADLGGTVTATVSPGASALSLTVANHTPHALHDCKVLANGAWVMAGDLPSGGSRTVNVGALTNSTAGGGWGNLLPSSAPYQAAENSHPDVRQRMRTALAEFARGLGGPNGGQSQYYGGNYAPPAAFAPRPGEAILTGWCDDPALAGSPVRVDGHPVTENDVTLVVVHVPLH